MERDRVERRGVLRGKGQGEEQGEVPSKSTVPL